MFEYKTPEVEVIEFDTDIVVTTSNETDKDE